MIGRFRNARLKIAKIWGLVAPTPPEPRNRITPNIDFRIARQPEPDIRLARQDGRH